MSKASEARDIALAFCNDVLGKVTKSDISRAVIQAKQILDEGYGQDDVLLVIDYIHKETKTKMYSLGYVKAVIKDVLPIAITHRDKNKVKEEQAKLIEELRSKEEVNDASRNRAKAKRDRVLTRFGEKHSFDLLTK